VTFDTVRCKLVLLNATATGRLGRASTQEEL
jgi:hypothetical protein